MINIWSLDGINPIVASPRQKIKFKIIYFQGELFFHKFSLFLATMSEFFKKIKILRNTLILWYLRGFKGVAGKIYFFYPYSRLLFLRAQLMKNVWIPKVFDYLSWGTFTSNKGVSKKIILRWNIWYLPLLLRA